LTSSRKRVQINHPQTIARVFGVLFLITFLTSIPAFFFYGPVLNDPRYILGGGGGDTSVAFGAFLELILIISNIGTAVVPYPIFRRQNEILALGYVTARIVECTFILVGLLSLLTVVTLRQEEAAAGADAASFVAVGKTLVALHIWTSQLGPGFVVGIGNGLILGYLMYRSALVPRGMAVLGLIGGPLIIVTGVAVLLGFLEEGGVWQVGVIPEFFWELSLGIWPIVRGFNPSALARLEHQSA
jgi:branched-subunit amino acid transport protein AzlD